MLSCQRRAERDMGRLLTQSGGRLTDDIERRMTEQLIRNGYFLALIVGRPDVEPVLVEHRGNAALMLNRPDKLNALDYALIDQLLEVLDIAEDDDEVRAIVLTGAGERAFCSGADIACLRERAARGNGRLAGVRAARPAPDQPDREFSQAGHRRRRRPRARRRLRDHRGGAARIASERAEFCKAEINLGFAPPFGGTQRLPRLIGRKRALRMILAAEPIAAAEACRIGLVNDVVAHEDLRATAFELAHTIAVKSPLAVPPVSAA